MSTLVMKAPTQLGEATQKDKVVKAVGLAKRRSRWLWIALPLLAVGGVGVYLWQGSGTAKSTVSWQTVALDRGDLVTNANATGTLEPQRTISVGAEVSGKIESVLVEANDSVKKGQPLATFDTKSLKNSLDESQASLDAVRADISRAYSSLSEARANLSRTKTLAEKGVVSKQDLEAAKAASTRAGADLTSASAQERLSEARLETAKANLAKAVITSPIDGVVLSRNIEPGSTVAASFQTPELFSIAEDLRQMELHVAIDEADVGQVQAGQTATFTVAAWPEKTFNATVSKVYISPTITSNVVTYTVVLVVDNKEAELRPGMTATTTILTGTEKDTLRAPNKALRFTPAQTDESKGFSFTPPGMAQTKQHSKTPGLWVLRDNKPVKIEVIVGSTDGRYTAIKSEQLKAGDLVLVGESAVTP